MTNRWLLRNVELMDGWRGDVRVAQGLVSELGQGLVAGDCTVIEGQSRALCVGLKDHHIHLYAAAAAAESVSCSAADVASAGGLRQLIQQAPVNHQGWIRGIAHHPDDTVEIDRECLDRWRTDVPVRIQHASGRRWTMNSLAMDLLGPDLPDLGPWQLSNGQRNGHLYDQDAWLRERLQQLKGAAKRPNVASISRQLASWGVVALTDTGPSNGLDDFQSLQQAQASGELLQDLLMMGNADLDAAWAQQQDQLTAAGAGPRKQPISKIGPHKIHLLESALPDFEQLCEQISASHLQTRPVAFHCVSRAELVFAATALEQVGSIVGDRIEHAGICPDELLGLLKQLGVCVVTQPGFIYQRGDRYRRDVSAADQTWLYRLQSIAQAGIPIAGSSDAPYGDLNPWQGIAAAHQRRTALGHTLGTVEQLSVDAAVALYSGQLSAPGMVQTAVTAGQVADLCVLNQYWSQLREQPQTTRALLTLRAGVCLWRDDAL